MSSNSSLGNVVSRLQGLKNVSGRRVMPGEEILPDEPVDYENTTRSGIDYGELAGNLRAGGVAPDMPRGYDVRANKFIPPQAPVAAQELQEEELTGQETPGFWSNIGKNLQNFAQFHQNRGVSPQDMPQNEEIPQSMPGERSLGPQPGDEARSIPRAPNYQPQEMAQGGVQGVEPPVAPGDQQQPQEGAPQEGGAPVDQPKQEPLTYAEDGAVETAVQSPELRAELERLIGEPISPEMAAQAADVQAALTTFNQSKDVEHQALTDNQEAIRQRIESRNLSSRDKVLMTLALLAPAVLAGITMGKEGFFNVLEGTAGAASNVFSRNYKNQLDDEQKMSELAVQKGKIAREKIDEALKSDKQLAAMAAKLPNKGMKDLIMRDGAIVDGKLIVKTGNDLFPIDSTRVRDEADLKQFKKTVLPQLEAQNSLREQMSDIAGTMDKLLEFAEKQRGKDISATVTSGLFDNTPWLRDEFVDENGNVMKINEIYKGLRERYGELDKQFYKEKGTGSERDKRFAREFPDPFTSGLFQRSSKIPQARKQLELQMSNADKKMLLDAKARGVNTKFLEEQFKKNPYGERVAEEQRKANRVKDTIAEIKGK